MPEDAEAVGQNFAFRPDNPFLHLWTPDSYVLVAEERNLSITGLGIQSVFIGAPRIRMH